MLWRGNKLHVLPFDVGFYVRRGTADLDPGGPDSLTGKRRIFVGNGVAYISVSFGFETFDVTDSNQPKRLGKAASLGQRSFKQIVPNGTGKGLAAVAVNPFPTSDNDVYLYDLTDVANTTGFESIYATPGIASAISLFNGLAYVADGTAGLQVLNYLPRDTKGLPPTIALKTFAPQNEVSAGGLLLMRAQVTDDVQIRNVEFYVDGRRIVVDGNFPYETVYRVPTNRLGSDLILSAVAFDTGGNPAGATNAPIRVVPDNTPPLVSIDKPASGTIFYEYDDIPLQVTAVDNSGIDSGVFRLNGQRLPVRRLSLADWLIEVDLPLGTNKLEAVATDLAGLKSASNPVRFVVLKEAISREVSVFNFGPKDVTEAISREVSIFHFGPKDLTEAISREASAFNFGPRDVTEAISREVSTFNFGPPDKPEAISREVSVENKKPAATAAVRSSAFQRPGETSEIANPPSGQVPPPEGGTRSDANGGSR